MSVTAKIRMYNQKNLGDCFLLNFENDKGETADLLIDFGSYTSGNDIREREIAEHIKTELNGRDLTMVLTHQHKDHLSGFKSAKDILRSMTGKRNLWLSYLDDEQSEEGNLIRDVTKKYWQKSKKINALIEEKFAANVDVEEMLEQKKVYDLFAEDQTSGSAMTDLLDIADHNVTFLTPGMHFDLPGLSEGVKVYVLGPPYTEDLLKKMNPTKAEGVEGLNVGMAMADLSLAGSAMLAALENLPAGEDEATESLNDYPFNRQFIDDTPDSTPRKVYELPELQARRIDDEWLGEVGRMALHMDKFTNNTSLILAFELQATKKVLLFVGDAQIGNWQSWFDVKFSNSTVTGKDLLMRTVFYKAGHHSSHNATLKQGLDLMNEKELVVFVPVEEQSAKPFRMLEPGMMTGYNRKSKGCVFRADTVEQDASGLTTLYPFAKRTAMPQLKIIPDGIDDGHLALELTIKG